MATNTMVAIATYTLAATTSSVTFSAIPQTYKDLVLETSILMNGNQANVLMQVGNGSIDTGAHYSQRSLSGNGSTPATGRYGNGTYIVNTNNSYPQTSTWHTAEHNFMDYTNTTTYKSIISRGSNPAIGTELNISTWRGSTGSSFNAIDTIKIYPANNAFEVGSTFTLYGIAAQPVATAKATGGTISYGADGYTYHAFTSSGTFTPSANLVADILVVAGGGGSPGVVGSYGGGGGAGGLLGFTSQSLANGTGYTCTIGGPGAGGAPNSIGSNGGDSQFGALTLVKGGGAGGPDGSPGNAGGSSGGGTGTSPSPSVTGQGYRGGSNTSADKGGGGGAGGVGADGSTTYPFGQGGIGSSAYSTWGLITGTGHNVSGTVYYAGGGGGANNHSSQQTPGGYGGGGNGAYYTPGNNGSAGAANTGGGGGGQVYSSSASGYAGGSGIIIVRYAS